MKILFELKENSSLAITNEKTLDALVDGNYSFEKIKTFHYVKAVEDQKIPHVSKLFSICHLNLNNLLALNLSCICCLIFRGFYGRL